MEESSFSLEELLAACNSAGTNIAHAFTVPDSENVVDNDGLSESTSVAIDHDKEFEEEYPGDLMMGRKRSKKADKSKWKKIVNQKNRMRGEKYQAYVPNSNQGGQSAIIMRPARHLGPTCTSKLCQNRKTRYCDRFVPSDRQLLFKQFWQEMSWEKKKTYVASNIDQHKSVRKTTEGKSRRQDTYCYFLKLGGKKRQVCKAMFLSTLGLKEKQVYGWLSQKSHPEDKQRKIIPPSDKRLNAMQFLDSLPKLPSHYCRKSTSKLYLETMFNSKRQLFRVYEEWSKENGYPSLVRSAFMSILEMKNISLYQPKKDECDLCSSYKAGNLEESVYQDHISKKNSARAQKEQDKSDSRAGKCHAITMDLQSVLLAPMLNASALYYKTKLVVHNFTIYDLDTRDVRCYLWDESEGQLASSVFATCILDYLERYDDNQPIIIYSDGCTAQNRNHYLSNALLEFATRNGKIVYQKFLEKGHTQMEVDSVHSAIERKLKNSKIYVPGDYVEVLKAARIEPEPYSVTHMTHDKFKDFTYNLRYTSIRPGSKTGDPCVTDIRCLKYNPDGTIFYKLDYDQDTDWKILPRKPSVVKAIQRKNLYSKRLPIPKRKFQDLKDLLHVIPVEHHNFYNNIPKLSS